MNERRKIKPITENVDEVNKNNVQYFYKKPSSTFDRSAIEQELKGYDILRPYFNMPIVHTAPPQASSLAIAKVKGFSLDKLINYEFKAVDRAMMGFLSDLSSTWKRTSEDFETNIENEISFDALEEANHTIRRIEKGLALDPLMSEKLSINGIPFTDTTIDLLNKLKSAGDVYETPVISHGDEHFGNIFTHNSSRRYMIIDPRNTGFQIPSASINRLIGTTLIFMLDYEIDFNTGNHIHFKLNNDLSLEEDIYPLFQKMINSLDEFTNKQHNLKKLLTVNLLRAYALLVDKKNISHVEKNRFAYLALAHKIFNNPRII